MYIAQKDLSEMNSYCDGCKTFSLYNYCKCVSMFSFFVKLFVTTTTVVMVLIAA